MYLLYIINHICINYSMNLKKKKYYSLLIYLTGDSSFENANIKHDTKYVQIILFQKQKSKYSFKKKT